MTNAAQEIKEFATKKMAELTGKIQEAQRRGMSEEQLQKYALRVSKNISTAISLHPAFQRISKSDFDELGEFALQLMAQSIPPDAFNNTKGLN